MMHTQKHHTCCIPTGLSPLRYSKKTGVAKDTTLSDVVQKHVMAALLIPISQYDRKNMLKQVTIPVNDLELV